MTRLSSTVSILIADDDPEDRELALRALTSARLANAVHMVEDGEELMDYLLHRGAFAGPNAPPRPGLLLLDLRMPRKDGFTALREIRAHPELRSLPVVILTTSSGEQDVYRGYDLGVNSYITKPVTFAGLVEAMTLLGRYWFEIVALPASGDAP